jgi:hypothetical protein
MSALVWGLMAEFGSPAELLAATRRAYAAGYRRMDAYSPFPVHGLDRALHLPQDRVALICLAGGILGGGGAYLLQWWINSVAYPLNIGGRPFHSWPSFLIVTFEMTVLFAGIAAVAGMLGLNGLPRPYHPVFNVERFAAASCDRFFLAIEADDPLFERAATREFLESLNPAAVEEVPD